MRDSVPAVITAGGRISGEFATVTGTPIKALIPMEGKPLVQRVLEALRDSGRVAGPVIIVGPERELQSALAAAGSGGLSNQICYFVPEGQTGPENMVRGLSAIPESGEHDWALLCTCDLPFLTGEALCWLLDNAPEDADIVFPIATKGEYEAAFPGTPGTYMGVEGEHYTGGSIFLVRPSAISKNQALIERIFAARKDVFSLARLGGFGLIVRLLTGTLTVEYVEARVSQLTGCRCRVVRHAPPSLAADIDTMEDYRFASGQRQMTTEGTRA